MSLCDAKSNGSGETLSVTAQRLIRWGTSERTRNDAVVEETVIEALVMCKEAVDGDPYTEYLNGQRRTR